jgi:hypothetical protein
MAARMGTCYVTEPLTPDSPIRQVRKLTPQCSHVGNEIRLIMRIDRIARLDKSNVLILNRQFGKKTNHKKTDHMTPLFARRTSRSA